MVCSCLVRSAEKTLPGCFFVELTGKICGCSGIRSKTAPYMCVGVSILERCCQVRLFQAFLWTSLEKSGTKAVLKTKIGL